MALHLNCEIRPQPPITVANLVTAPQHRLKLIELLHVNGHQPDPRLFDRQAALGHWLPQFACLIKS